FTELGTTAVLPRSLHDALPIYRYYEALVHPAMLRAPRRERVLAIGGGHGFLETELLRYPDLLELTVLVVDEDLLELSASAVWPGDRKSTRLNSSHVKISYAVFC